MKPRAAAFVTVALLLALGHMACGGDSGAPTVPDDAVAIVGDTEISQERLDQRVAALRRAQPRQSREEAPDDAESSAEARRQLNGQALSTLLAAEALEQEAADRGIAVGEAEVRQRWRSVASQQFQTRRALRRFLGGQTERDVVAQLRLQALAERIHEQVASEAGGGKRGQRAVERFQREFRKRSREETTCREGLDAVGC